MSGGKAIEHLAKQGNRLTFDFQPPMQRAKNCDFSFSGLQHVIDKMIMQKEKEEGIFVISKVGQISNTSWYLKIPAHSCRYWAGADPVFSCRHCCCSPAHRGLPHCKKNASCYSVLQAERLVTAKQRSAGKCCHYRMAVILYSRSLSFPFQGLTDHKHRMERSWCHMLSLTGRDYVEWKLQPFLVQVWHFYRTSVQPVWQKRSRLHLTEFKRGFTVWNKMQYNCYHCF